jgi:PucR C-terminal helix-turn-helix domain
MALLEAAIAEERAARALLQRIGRDEPQLAEDHQLAERIGFPLGAPALPFVASMPGSSPQLHARLAAHLRGCGALAASEGPRVVGLSHRRLPWRGLRLDAGAILAEGQAAIGAERVRAFEELRAVVEAAASRGETGEIAVGDHLPELLLLRSPQIADRIVARIYGPLTPDLSQTLDLLVAHSFERGAAAAALPAHRNTLRDRINRISKLTGVNLDSVEGRGLAWLAWLRRREAG